MVTSELKKYNPQIWFVGPYNNQYSDKIKYASIEDCYNYCKDKEVLGEDIETTIRQPLGTYKNEHIYQPGLDPYLSKVVMLQIGDLENIYVIDTRVVDIGPLFPLWQVKERVWVGHNLKFEAKHLLYNYDIIHQTIWDCMLVEQNLYNGLGLRNSLEALTERYLNVKPVQKTDLFTIIDEEQNEEDSVFIDKSTRMGFLTIGNKPFTEKQILYGSDDILYPLIIRQEQMKGVGSYNPIELHKLENKFCLCLADIELVGMTFDRNIWLDTYYKNKIVYEHRLQKLNKYVEKKYPKFCSIPDLFGTPPGCTIQWSSSKQVIDFFRYLDICPKEKSKQTGRIEFTVGAKTLVKKLSNPYKEKYNNDEETDIVTEEDLILNYLLLKVSEQACTTFGEEWLKYIHPITGRIHSSYKQILNTGRMSSTKPNLQNIPAEEDYRKAFVANKNCKLINADYSSQESRVLADKCGDKSMIEFFNNGHPVHGNDFHSMTATKMFSLMRNEPSLIVTKKTHPDERNVAKSIGFKIAYGGSAYTLKDDFGVAEEVAQEFIDSYLNAFPALNKYFEEGKKFAVDNGYIHIDNVVNRRYWERDYKRMQFLNENIWKLYPENYRQLSEKRKKEVKEKINTDHPEIKGMWKEYFTLKGELERCSQNYPIQGTAGGQTKTACIIFRNYILKNNLRNKVWMTNVVHDETLVECIEEFAEEAKNIVEKSMVDGASIFCKKVKMEATGVITDFWHH